MTIYSYLQLIVLMIFYLFIKAIPLKDPLETI